jgi:hypothetical protein
MYACLQALLPFFPFPISTLKKKKVLSKLRRIVLILRIPCRVKGTAVAQWLSYCATNQKVAGLIPDGVMKFFIDINPGVDSASNRNENQVYFLGLNAAGA